MFSDVYIYIYISNYYLLGHVNRHIIHLFLAFSFLLLIIFLHIKFSFYNYTSSNIPKLLPFYIPTTLYFDIAILLSLSLSFILTFLLPTLFTRKFWYSFFHSIHILPALKGEYNLFLYFFLWIFNSLLHL